MAKPGASIEVLRCPNRYGWRTWGACLCRPRCAICGLGPHMGAHGPVLDQPIGSPAFDHAYTPEGA